MKDQSPPQTEVLRLKEFARRAEVDAKLDPAIQVETWAPTLDALKAGRLKLSLLHRGPSPRIMAARLRLLATGGNITAMIGTEDAALDLGAQVSGQMTLMLWHGASVRMGDQTTANGLRIIAANSSFSCGRDCMFSDEIVVQTSDQHGIVDLATGEIVNDEPRTVTLGDHVWVGRAAMLGPRAEIGTGSIIAMGALVTGPVGDYSLAAGVPARVIREGVTWSRSPGQLDAWSARAVKEHKAKPV